MDFNSWWTWAIAYEPILGKISISPTVPAILTDAYNESVDNVSGLICYLSTNNYQLLVYRLALHLLITSSKNSNIYELKNLYNSYGIEAYAGILTSAGDGSSNASKLIPTKLQDGDAETLALFATPYGRKVEAVYEQLRNLAITA